jgi:sulfofructose kinase
MGVVQVPDAHNQDDAGFDVLGLGAVAIDDLLYVDAYPPADVKTPVRSRGRQFGGLAGTALVAVARLGGRAAYAGVLGDDEMSEAAIAGLASEGVDVRHVVRRPGARPVLSTIVVSREGTRNIFVDRTGAHGADTEWPEPEVIRRSRVLLVDNIGVPGMLRAARIARAAGVPVVADFESDDDPEIENLFPLVDHLILSSGFAERRTGLTNLDAMVNRLWDQARAVVAVTCGAGGVWYRASGDDRVKFLPAYQVEAVDSTGCGDVFHGAYALGLSRGMDVPARIRLAAATAAIKATKPGGQAGIPDSDTVAAFLRER